MTPPPPEVQALLDQMPTPACNRLMQLRKLIINAAEASAAAPLEECLKWGQPAYLPRRKRVGTTIRLGWSEKRSDLCSVYVPCSTNLLDQYRHRFPGLFVYHGAREVTLPLDGPIDTAALQQMAAMALTYHRMKNSC